MSTPFKPEWLELGAVIPVDIPTLAAFAQELRRVNQENRALREWVGLTDRDIDECYFAARQPDFDVWAFAEEIEAVLKEKNS